METNGAVLTRSSKVFEGMFEDAKVLKGQISSRMKYYMKKTKTSQPKLAQAVGCSRDTIFGYVNGKIQEENMDIGILKKTAKYFGVDEHYFCNEYHVLIDTINVSDFLKQLRGEKNMSQRKFADILKIPLSSYKKYETGDVKIPEKYWRVLRNKCKNDVLEIGKYRYFQ